MNALPEIPSEALQSLTDAIQAVSRVVQGKLEVVRLSFLALIAEGHLLLEDVPGLGKTTLARAIAASLGGDFRRIQMTADLLPADIVGGPRPDLKTGELSLRKGPIFTQLLLADELNRATPRTQSGMLEAMAERSVTVDGVSYALPRPFFVIATQNPVEHAGVYPLPQSQLDRFLVRTAIGYPEDAVEKALLMDEASRPRPETIPAMLSPEALRSLMEAVTRVRLGPEAAEYLHRMVRATRNHPDLSIGVSTRGALAFAQAARTEALLSGRSFVSPDDVYAVSVPVIAHRVSFHGAQGVRLKEAELQIAAIRDGVSVPL